MVKPEVRLAPSNVKIKMRVSIIEFLGGLRFLSRLYEVSKNVIIFMGFREAIVPRVLYDL